jgi:hypothetical protein
MLEILPPSSIYPEDYIHVWDVVADPRWLNIWSYRDCMFGVRAKTVDANFNSDDRRGLAEALLDELVAKGEERVEGSGVVKCGDNGAEVEWAFYEARASEWN